jgi:hypothetical protein
MTNTPSMVASDSAGGGGSGGKESEPAPDHIDQRRRLANAARTRERRLKFVAANSLHEMRNAVGQKSAGNEVRKIIVPEHESDPFRSPSK